MLFFPTSNEDPDRIPTLDAILDEILSNDNDKIVTSVISKIEVAWVATEKERRALNTDQEARFDEFWNDSSVVELVDLNDEITHITRSLLRRAMEKGWGLRPNDAIHLATAEWVGAVEMNTYDEKLYKYHELIALDIKAPYAKQPKLF